MNDKRRPASAGNEQTLEEIFRHATPRPQPDDAARTRAFDALHAEWHNLTGRRRRNRRRVAAGLAATAVLALFAGYAWLGSDAVAPPAPFAVDVLRASGSRVYLNESYFEAAGLAASDLSLAAGDELSTADDARMALAWGGGSLRFDAATRIRLQADGAVRLLHGALYFDSTPYGAAGPVPGSIVIETPRGRISHLGTQFLASVAGETVRLQVREGEVRIAGRGVDLAVDAGEAVSIGADGDVERLALDSWGTDWQWAADIAPELEFAGRTTAEVLDWIARETGYRVRYGSSEARALAASEPRGIESLAPMPALRTIPYITSLGYTIEGGHIVVDTAGGGAER